MLEAPDLRAVQEQLALAHRVVIAVGALRIGADVRPVQEHLPVALDGAIGVGQVQLAVAQALDLGADQRNARLEALQQLVVEARLAVVGDQLGACLGHGSGSGSVSGTCCCT